MSYEKKFQVDDRVKNTGRGTDNFGKHGVVVGVYGMLVRVQYDTDALLAWDPDSILVKVMPLEELAAQSRKNPRFQNFQNGDRVVKRYRDRGLKGFVTTVYGGFVQVHFDGEEEPGWMANRDIEKLGMLEEIAEQVKKNPGNYRPRVGERVVHFLDESCSRPGTVTRTGSGSVVVQWDDGERAVVYESVVRPYSPLEEIAKVVRQMKGNPDQDWVVGDLVRVTKGVRKGKIGKVLVVTHAGGYIIGMEDRALQYSYEQLEKLTPLELLALTVKKNPQMYKHFEKGQRVSYKGSPATVHRCRRGEAHVHFDGQESDPRGWKLPSNDLELLSPLEELAALSKKVKKNPELAALRKKVKKNPEKGKDLVGLHVHVLHVGTAGTRPRLGIVKEYVGGQVYDVAFLDDLYPTRTLVSDHYIEQVAPIEELSLVSKIRKTKKNPNPPYAVGERVIQSFFRPAASTLRGRVGTVTQIGATRNVGSMRLPCVWVQFDGDVNDAIIEISTLRRISPLEELARAGGGGK